MPISDTALVLGSLGSSLLSNVGNLITGKNQREYDRRMWFEQAEYNSPNNQKQRLIDAGINPALALVNGSLDSGVMSNSSGGQSAPQMDFSPIAHSVRDSVDLYQQRRLQDAQIGKLNEESTNQSIRNRYENQRQIIELDKMLADKRLSDSQREYYLTERNRLVEENKWIDKRNSSQIHKTMMDAFAAQQEGRYKRVMTAYQSIVNQFAPDQQKQVLSNLQAKYNEIMSAALNNNRSAAEHAASTALKNVEKDTAEKLQKHVVDKAFEEASMIRDNNERSWLRELHESTGKAGSYLPHAGRAYHTQQGYVNFYKKRRLR